MFHFRVSSRPCHKQETRLEGLAGDKPSSLSRKFENHGQKTFYNIGPKCQSYKTLLFGTDGEENKLERLSPTSLQVIV